LAYNNGAATTERADIQRAVRTLRTIQEDKLGYPKWDKTSAMHESSTQRRM